MIAALLLALLVTRAQEPPRANDLPLRNDCALPLAKEAAAELERGDGLERGSAQAFDAWMRALQNAAQDPAGLVPLPADQGGSARGGESAELGVLRRLAALVPPGWGAWRARFDEIAAGELAVLAREESVLERFLAAHAGTQAAQRAALALADLARERGDTEAARAALARARAQGPLDAPLEAALARRALPEEPSASRAAVRLEPLFELELADEEARDDWIEPRRAGAALAELGDGRLLWWCAGALRVVDAAGRAETVDLPALSGARGWSWIPPFRDAASPWTPALLARGARALLVLGRARAEEGNLFAALDFAPRSKPALAWAWESSGLQLGAREDTRLLPAGLWEYQPGACESAGRVYLLARRFASAAEARPALDELHAQTFALCLELGSGALLWQRELGTGSDPATRDPARRPEPRGICTGADALALEDGQLACSSGLGWLSLLDLPRGRVLGAWRAGLEAESLGERALVCAPLLGQGRVLWQPAASDWSYRLEPGGTLERLPADGTQLCALLRGRSWSIRHAPEGLRVETRLSGAAGARTSVALARGERAQAVLALGPELLALATERGLYLFDDRDPVRLSARARLPRAAARGSGGAGALVANGERLVCAVGSALVAFRVR